MSDNDYSRYSNYLKTSSDSWRGYKPYYRDYEDNDKTRIRELTIKLQSQNDEISDLRFKLEQSEKDKYDLEYDLDRFERDYHLADQRSIDRENELLEKIRTLELEKSKIEDNYYKDFKYSSVNRTPDEEFLFRENRRLKDQNIKNELKLDLMSRFFNRVQNYVQGRITPRPYVLIESMDVNTLREKLNHLELDIERMSNISREHTKGLVLGNSEIINSKMKDINEENEYLRRKIEVLDYSDEKQNEEKSKIGSKDLRQPQMRDSQSRESQDLPIKTDKASEGEHSSRPKSRASHTSEKSKIEDKKSKPEPHKLNQDVPALKHGMEKKPVTKQTTSVDQKPTLKKSESISAKKK